MEYLDRFELYTWRAGRGPAPQSGAALVLGMVGMLALLACVGMALDGSHLLLTKTRLQNMADAAALHAAQVYDDTSDKALAQAAVSAALTLNAGLSGHAEVGEAITSGAISVTTEFSNTLVPFTPGGDPGPFIRVRMTNFRLPAWLLPVIGIDDMGVGVSSIAGPSPALTEEICDIAPIMVCGEEDTDPDDDMVFGYEKGQFIGMKHSSGGESDVGPGNFQLVRLPGSAGGADIRRAMAGEYDPASCLSAGDVIETEPGNTVGPTYQGINTRFGIYNGGQVNATDHPPDYVTSEPSTRFEKYEDVTGDGVRDLVMTGGNKNNPVLYDPDSTVVDFAYADYLAAYRAMAAAGTLTNSARINRRMLTVPVGLCDGGANGQNQVELLGFACVYLVQSLTGSAQGSISSGRWWRAARPTASSSPIPMRPAPTPPRSSCTRTRTMSMRNQRTGLLNRGRASGVALLEVTIMLPLFALLLLATAEIGRMVYTYNTLTKRAESGARYLSQDAFLGTIGAINLSPAKIAALKNMVVYGNPAGGGAPAVAGLSAGNISVSAAASDFLQVDIAFTYQPIFGATLSFFGFGPGINIALPINTSIRMRAHN